MKGSLVTVKVSMVTPRLDTKPWGGRRLERLGIDLGASDRIGEALTTAGDAHVSGGAFQGQTLDDIVRANPDDRLGSFAREAVAGRSIFPLLTKLIDANEHLSIQVHPDDAGARPLDKPGKTEAWHVLAADPGSELYLGLKPGVHLDSFRESASRLDGSSAALMRTVPAQAGTTVLIPAGTIHALGAGVMVYEIQQPSDITYRLDDWGRTDAAGNPRDVHLAAGLAVSRPELMPEIINPVPLRAAIGERHILAACRYFVLERVALPVGASASVGSTGSPVAITLVTGSGIVGDEVIEAGRSAVVWPSPSPAILRATAPMVVLLAYVPDLERDVVGRAAGSGASMAAITALGGPTGDLLRTATARSPQDG